MKIDGKAAEQAAILQAANEICAAIRTAPKGCGIDHLVSFGASPRASIALALAAKGLALLRERAFVLPQDVKDIAPDVLRHRLVLSYEAEAENIDADAVISRLLSELRTP